MGYCSASDVAALTPHLVKPASSFDTTICPTLTQVNAWISTGSLVIDSKLSTMGYSSPGATTAVYGLLQQANAAYGAWFAERSRISARVSDDPNTRDRQMKRDFTDLLDMLGKMDLTTMGVRKTTKKLPYMGGQTFTDKETDESDSDMVQHRFKRGQLENRESLKPRGSTSASSTN